MKLHAAIDSYVASKVSSGVQFGGGMALLRSFEKRVGDVPLASLQERHLLYFLDKPSIGQNTWRNKYFYLFRFFQYCCARNFMVGIKMPENRVPRPTNYVPHVYSRLELKRMLKVIPEVQLGKKVAGGTFQALILFLYGTGTTAHEVQHLRCGDVDWKKRQVAIYTKKIGRARLLPISSDLYAILRKYDRSVKNRRLDDRFFITDHGGRITSETLHRNFAEVRRAAGIITPGGAKLQPRLLDLRHTFAVHRIASWVKHGADLNRMVPALSMYLGFTSLSSAERYFRLTPERFKKQLDLLLPAERHSRWSSNIGLMKFVDSL